VNEVLLKGSVFSAGERIGWEGDLVVHPNLNFHLNCSKCGVSVNSCSDASPTVCVV